MRGRPRKIVDESRIIELASKAHSFNGIAVMLGISEDTLRRNYSAACDKGRELMRTSLLNKQYEVAMGNEESKPNPIMLIWLGKQHLGQADKQDIDVRKQTIVRMVVGIEQNELTQLTNGYHQEPKLIENTDLQRSSERAGYVPQSTDAEGSERLGLNIHDGCNSHSLQNSSFETHEPQQKPSQDETVSQ